MTKEKMEDAIEIIKAIAISIFAVFFIITLIYGMTSYIEWLWDIPAPYERIQD
jgi:predicted ABC-type exoprotein transport system permease subunit